MGIRKDLKLVGNDFSNAATWFFIAYLIAQAPLGMYHLASDPAFHSLLMFSSDFPPDDSPSQMARGKCLPLGCCSGRWCRCPGLSYSSGLTYLPRHFRSHNRSLSDAAEQSVLYQERSGATIYAVVYGSRCGTDPRWSYFLWLPACEAQFFPRLARHVPRSRAYYVPYWRTNLHLLARRADEGKVVDGPREGRSLEARQCQPDRCVEQ
jgi:hypothetical protein